MKLAAVRLFVHDIEAARQFYEGTLGLVLKYDGTQQGFCLFESGAVEVLVEFVASDAPLDDQSLVGRFTGLSFDVADIQVERRRLGALGVVFSGEPERQFWGGWLATFSDPSGNSLQIAQRAG